METVAFHRLQRVVSFFGGGGGGGGKGRQEYTSRWNTRTLDFRIALFPFLLGRISWIYIGVGGIRGGICSEVFLRLKNRDIVGSIR